jgi:hypothetical protein
VRVGVCVGVAVGVAGIGVEPLIESENPPVSELLTSLKVPTPLIFFNSNGITYKYKPIE